MSNKNWIELAIIQGQVDGILSILENGHKFNVNRFIKNLKQVSKKLEKIRIEEQPKL